MFTVRSLIATPALLAAACANTPTPPGTVIATVDTSAAIKQRYSGPLQPGKKVQVVVKACEFRESDAPDPALLRVFFETASNDKGDEHFIKDLKVEVEDAKGWTITSKGGESFSMGAAGGTSDFYQSVSTRIGCVQKSGPIGGREVEGPLVAKADGSAVVH